MCRNLDVSKAGYYAWRRREETDRSRRDAELLAQIRRVYIDNRRLYGRPRIHKELRKDGIRVSGKRLARLMQINGIKGKKRSYSKSSSTSPGTIAAAPNVLNRQFKVPEPNRSWVSDITQFPTSEGVLYLAVVIDLFSRRVVGWSMDTHVDTELVLSALKMSLRNRAFETLILHSDRGSQYNCRAYLKFLEQHGIVASMSRKGNCWDNAVAESFFASLKVEVKPDHAWRTRTEARTAIFDYIETWYNPKRRHSSNDYLSPNAFEAAAAVT
jgi:putative transposase